MTSFSTLVADFQKSGTLHHALLVEGERTVAIDSVRNFIREELGMPTTANPDIWEWGGETFGIDEARAVRERQNQHSLNGGLKIFIIVAQRITSEAQNALLKVAEEPTPDTHIFFIVPHAETLLQTLRSRMFLAHAETKAERGPHVELAHQLLGASTVAERLALVKKMIDEKDTSSASALVDELIRAIRQKSLREKLPVAVLEELLRCRGYLAGRSPSVKMVLEHVVHMVPLEGR